MTKSRKFGALTVIVIFLTLYGRQAVAQRYSDDPKLFYVGVVGGGNFAQIDGDNFAGYYKAGLNVGGIGYAQLKEHTAVSWEILFSQRGAKSNIERVSNTDTNVLMTDYNVRLNYAEVPVMFNYFDKRKSHFGVGASYARLVGSSEKMTTYPATNVDFSKYPYRKNAVDLLASAQLHLTKGLFLNIRFQYSLIPVRDVSPLGYARSNKQFNNMWTVRLMYLFI